MFVIVIETNPEFKNSTIARGNSQPVVFILCGIQH